MHRMLLLVCFLVFGYWLFPPLVAHAQVANTLKHYSYFLVNDVDIPNIAPHSTDILFGHSWETNNDPTNLANLDINTLNLLNQNGLKGIVSMTSIFYSTHNFEECIGYPDWQDRWNTYWSTIKSHASHITALYPLDEANVFCQTATPSFNQVVGAIQSSLDADNLDIPIAVILTGWGPYQLKNGSFTLPPGIDWVSFDQYGCWEDCSLQPSTIRDKFNYLVDYMSPRGGKVFIVPGGYIPQTSPQTVPASALYTVAEDAKQAAIAKNFFDLCTQEPLCVAVVPFRWNMADWQGLGIVNMPVSKEVYLRQGYLVKNSYFSLSDARYTGSYLHSFHGLTASASHTNTGSNPTNLIDNALNTAWNSGIFPSPTTNKPDFTIDLKQPKTVKSLRIRVVQTTTGPTTLFLESAGTNQVFSRVGQIKVTEGLKAGAMLLYTFPDPLTNIRYLRVAANQYPAWVAFYEAYTYIDLPGDYDRNGVLDVKDTTQTINAYKANVCTHPADFNNDCTINLFDYNTLLSSF